MGGVGNKEVVPQFSKDGKPLIQKRLLGRQVGESADSILRARSANK